MAQNMIWLGVSKAGRQLRRWKGLEGGVDSRGPLVYFHNLLTHFPTWHFRILLTFLTEKEKERAERVLCDL